MYRAALAFSILLTMTACSGPAPSAPSTAPDTPAPAPPTVGTTSSTTRVYDGTWAGVTTEGFPLDFTITEDHIRSFYIEFPQIPGSSCVFGPGGFEIDGSQNFDLAGKGDPAIVNDRFTIVSRAPMYTEFANAPSVVGTTNFTLTGTLAGTTGEGTGEFSFSTGSCFAYSPVRWNIRLVT